MNKQVFIINGSGGVGKDTFVELVSKVFNLSVMNFSSVDKVKEIARIIGWTGGKTEKDRKFLSDLKLLCTDYNNMPFNSMSEKVKEFTESDAAMLFLHIREPEEIEKAKEYLKKEHDAYPFENEHYIYSMHICFLEDDFEKANRILDRLFAIGPNEDDLLIFKINNDLNLKLVEYDPELEDLNERVKAYLEKNFNYSF